MIALSDILNCIEKQPLLYKVLIRLVTPIDPRFRAQLLRILNPSFTLGALAVIVDPSSPPDDPVVLLGYHPYRDKEVWDLLGGAFKREDTDPATCLLREVSEETKLEIEVVDPIAVNVDKGIINFYFECTLRHGYPNLADALASPEITELGWFKLSALPSDMSVGNRHFLTNVYLRAPKLAGASWTVQHQPSPAWRHLRQAEDVRSTWGVEADASRERLARLLEDAGSLLNCDVVSLFAADAPQTLTGGGLIPGTLRHILQWSRKEGRTVRPADPLELPLTVPTDRKLGLTVALFHSRPAGRAIRLHNFWLQHHPEVKSSRGHSHLTSEECRSVLAVPLVANGRVVGLLKAENKFGADAGKMVNLPFSRVDCYLMEGLGASLAPLLTIQSPAGHVSPAVVRELGAPVSTIETCLDSLKRRLPLNGDQDLRQIIEEMSDSAQEVKNLLRELDDPLRAETMSPQAIDLPSRCRLTGGRRNGFR